MPIGDIAFHHYWNDNPYDPITPHRDMAGEIRSGEKIQRRPLPDYETAGSFSRALARDGFLGTALEDKNEFGPNAMILLLLIVATITGGLLLLSRYIF